MSMKHVMDSNLDDSKRTVVIDGLKKFLADTYTLYLTTHNFHWNVTGPHFNSLHQMFMVQYNELWLAVDLIAERLLTLGSFAPGSYKQFAQLTSLPDVPDSPPEAMKMVSLLMKGNHLAARTARSVVPDAEEIGDQATSDLLVSRIAVHEKVAWMLRATLAG